MDKLMQVFENAEFGQVRTAMRGDTPYAAGVDVARALGYANPSKAVLDHCKGVSKLGIPSPGGVQETNMIPESDIYRLIVKAADQSANPEIKAKAERFEHWIFDEVLPQIRKTGQYSIAQHKLPASYVEALRELADTVEQKTLLEAKIDRDKPKVEFAERVKDADGAHTMNQVAKLLGWGEIRLFAYLRDRQPPILMSNNMPLQRYMAPEHPYFKVIENVIHMKNGDVIKPQPLVTAKGLIWLQKVVPPPAKNGFPGHRNRTEVLGLSPAIKISSG